MRLEYKAFLFAVFIVLPIQESMAKHVKDYEQSIPLNKTKLASYNYMSCVMLSFEEQIQRVSNFVFTKSTPSENFDKSFDIDNNFFGNKLKKCKNKFDSITNLLPKSYVAGMDSVVKSFIEIFLENSTEHLNYSKDFIRYERPDKYRNTTIIFSRFGTIARPSSGNVYIMPDGQEMAFTEDDKWVPCNYIASQCMPITNQ